jgi:large subunit ribosomal protein L21
MYAVINDRGRQYRATTGDRLILDRSEAEVGSTIELPLLLLANEGGIKVGAPTVAGAKAVCKVVDHPRGEKGTVGKYKRRKRSMRRKGFRHEQTLVEVVSIG